MINNYLIHDDTNGDGVCNLEQVCRTCSTFFNQSSKLLIPLFQEYENSAINSLNLLQIAIKENDGLPQQICENCFKQLTNIQKFHKLCCKTQEQLKQFFFGSINSNFSNDTIIENPLEIQIASEINKNEYVYIPLDIEIDNLDDESDLFKIDIPENSQDTGSSDSSPLLENKKKKCKSKKKEKTLSNKDEKEQRHNKNVERSMVCESCSQSFIDERHFNIHARTHKSDLFPYICNYCEKDFLTLDELKEHKIIHFCCQCEFCGQIFQHITTLKIHQHKKHNVDTSNKRNVNKLRKSRQFDRNFKCPLCKEAFILPSALQKHLDVHSSDRKFKCSKCNYGFKRATHLTRHFNNAHSENSPYECRHCDKTFKDTEQRNKHERKHRNENYECSHCKKVFILREYLVSHERLHTKELRSICTLCGLKFSSSRGLAYHFRAKHTSEESEQLKAKILADNADLIGKSEINLIK